jgi:hypothetical protein
LRRLRLMSLHSRASSSPRREPVLRATTIANHHSGSFFASSIMSCSVSSWGVSLATCCPGQRIGTIAR